MQTKGSLRPLHYPRRWHSSYSFIFVIEDDGIIHNHSSLVKIGIICGSCLKEQYELLLETLDDFKVDIGADEGDDDVSVCDVSKQQ